MCSLREQSKRQSPAPIQFADRLLASTGIQFVQLPLQRIIQNVYGNLDLRRFILDDVFVIIALPYRRAWGSPVFIYPYGDR